ncbi:MAG TPA: accessory factor UbiK family protein [Casimicrobiaceae bacterium]|nr:accessory factor UbiK family protein [Casimicrobiaceae bacterium]
MLFNSQALDDLAARLGEAFRNSPAKDIEKNVKSMLTASLARLDLVTREEFDLQRHVLERTREKVEALEARVAELEARERGVMPPVN